MFKMIESSRLGWISNQAEIEVKNTFKIFKRNVNENIRKTLVLKKCADIRCWIPKEKMELNKGTGILPNP